MQITPYYPPHSGGVEVVCRGMAEGLAGRHPVEVLTTTCGAKRQPRLVHSGNLTVRRLRAFELLHTPIAPGLLLRVLFAPRDAVVHVHAAMPLTPEIVWIACAMRRRQFIIHFHGAGFPRSALGRRIFQVYARAILGKTLRAASKVLALNDAQADLLVRDFGVDPDDIAVVPNAAGQQFVPGTNAQRPATGPCRLLYVGRIHPVKAVPRLVQAIALMSEPAEAVIVGDGPGVPELNRLIRQLALRNVRLVGAQGGDDLVRWYRWADVFVLPSESEGMPLVMLEAMASGLPIVATDVSGSRETLGDAGVLVPPDASSLAAALDRLAGDPQLRTILAASSLVRARRHSWPALIDGLERIYGQVMP